MSSLRRRLLGTPTSTSREGSPVKAEEVRLAPISKIITEQHHKSRKRRNGFIFVLGGLFGIGVAMFFARRSDLIEFPELLNDLSMDSLLDVLPAGIVMDARDLMVSSFCYQCGLRIKLGRLANVWNREEKERRSITIPSKLDSTSESKASTPNIPL
jgi:hypothetical protein